MNTNMNNVDDIILCKDKVIEIDKAEYSHPIAQNTKSNLVCIIDDKKTQDTKYRLTYVSN